VHHVKARVNFQHFHLFDLNSRQNLAWRGMWLAIIGEIWNHRNEVIFKHKKVDPIEIFSYAQVVAWVWMKHKRVMSRDGKNTHARGYMRIKSATDSYYSRVFITRG